MRNKKILFYAGELIIGVFILFILSEISIRIFVPKYIYQFRDATVDWIRDDKLGWVNKPEMNVTFVMPDGKLGYFRTNHDGLASGSARRSKTAGVKRVMVFGDSFVVGRALNENERISAYLQAMLLNKGISVEVINAGVQGYSTDQCLLFMERLLPLYHPDLVIYAFSANDLGGNLLRKAYGVPKPRFIQQDDGSLRELPPMRPSGFKISTLGSGSVKKWIQYSAIYRLLRPYIVALRAKIQGWQKENLVGFIDEYYWNKEELNKADWPLFISLLKRMQARVSSYNAGFLFYSSPNLAEVWDPYILSLKQSKNHKGRGYNRYILENRLIEIAQKNKIDFCPLIDFFLKNRQRGPFHLLPRDAHTNRAGNQVAAEALTECISNAGYLNNTATPESTAVF